MKSYIVKLTMVDVEPAVWRKVILPAGATFNRLHEMIQRVTNFESYHTDQPYHFFEVVVDGLCITDNPVYREELKQSSTLTPKQPTRVKIDKYLEKHEHLLYTYDFGDDWRILIELESIVEDYHFGFPTLLDGEGAAPPEDVGGPPGFASFLAIMADPSDSEHDHMVEWASGTAYKPYDKKEINDRLKHVKYKKTEWDHVNHQNYVIISDPYRESEVSVERVPNEQEPAVRVGTEPEQAVEKTRSTEYEQEIVSYIRAMARLYGMVSCERVVSLYNRQNDHQMTIEELKEMVNSSHVQATLKKGNIFFKDDVFLGPKLVKIDPDQFVYETFDKPYYEPSKDELLRHADPGYFEQTPELLQLEKLFQKENIPQLQIDRMLHTFMEGLSEWHANFMEVIGRLMAQAGPLPEEHVKQIVPVAINVSNAVRLIENRGHTPQEMFEVERLQPKPLSEKTVVTATKVGRNDPCPCGSGKKYKKCCGR